MGGCWMLCLSIYFLNQGNNGHISLSSSVVRGLRTPLLRRNYDVGCRHTVGSNANACCEYSNPFILNHLILFRYVKWALKPIHTVIRSRGRWGGRGRGYTLDSSPSQVHIQRQTSIHTRIYVQHNVFCWPNPLCLWIVGRSWSFWGQSHACPEQNRQ